MRRMIREDERPAEPAAEFPGRQSHDRGRCPAIGAQTAESMLKGELDWIVMKALEKDRTRRYDTASDFAEDVARFLATSLFRPARHRGRITCGSSRNGIAAASRARGSSACSGWPDGRPVRQAVERGTRRAESAFAVDQALDSAERSAQASKWQEAMSAVNLAEARLEPGDDSLRQRTLSLKRDLAMVVRLDEIRQAMAAVKDDRFDIQSGDRQYAEAFRNYGIDGGFAGACRRGRLDAGRGLSRGTAGGPGRLDANSPQFSHGRRRRLETPVRTGHRPGRHPLAVPGARSLAEGRPECLEQPGEIGPAGSPAPQRRSAAGSQPQCRNKPSKFCVKYSSAGQATFWLNHALGMRLHDMKPPRIDEAIGSLRTATALRRRAPARS